MSAFDPAAAMAAAARGDRGGWESIVTKYSSLVWSVARAHGLSSADAADVFQGTWLRLVEHHDRIRDGSRLDAWLATTARREALMLLRRSGRDVPIDFSDGFGDSPDDAVGLEAQLISNEERRQLWQAFIRLPANCQRLLRVMFADPPPRYAEVSAALDIPVGSIGPTRARCLSNLESILKTDVELS